MQISLILRLDFGQNCSKQTSWAHSFLLPWSG